MTPKNYLTILLLVTVLVSAKAQLNQELSNNTFNNWNESGTAPIGWSTIESVFEGTSGFTIKDTEDKQNGQASLKLVTGQLNGLQYGVASIGNAAYVEGRGLLLQGAPYTSRPDSVWILYKYSSPGQDQGGIQIKLFKNTTGTQQVLSLDVAFPMAKKSEWGMRLINLKPHYKNSEMPDTMICAFSSSPKDDFRTEGSTLQVDGVYFNNPFFTGINDVDQGNFTFGIYPNPSSNSIKIETDKNLNGYQFELHPMNGQEAYRTRLSNNNLVVPTSELPTGNYIWLMVDTNGEIVGKGKWIKN